ncbi:MAG: hypothetical protein J3K34DRAFT_441656 [Monoraphidium minutum]|nr:MAG: hypothetical protein J3K34DRAFT_441656 [Monoraphidium minutum]
MARGLTAAVAAAVAAAGPAATAPAAPKWGPRRPRRARGGPRRAPRRPAAPSSRGKPPSSCSAASWQLPPSPNWGRCWSARAPRRVDPRSRTCLLCGCGCRRRWGQSPRAKWRPFRRSRCSWRGSCAATLVVRRRSCCARRCRRPGSCSSRCSSSGQQPSSARHSPSGRPSGQTRRHPTCRTCRRAVF